MSPTNYCHFLALFMATTFGSLDAHTPELLSPEHSGTSAYRFPNFVWTAHPGAWDTSHPLVEYEIQIARDRSFLSLVDEDSVTIAHYVHDRPFAPGTYYWRVRANNEGLGNGTWSPASAFTIMFPEERIVVDCSPDRPVDLPAAVDAAVAKAQKLAAAGKSVQIDFKQGDYHIDPSFTGHLIRLSEDQNITINGNGARIYFSTRKQALIQGEGCENVVVANFFCSYPSHRLYVQGRVTGVNAETGRMTVSIDPGFSDFNESSHLSSDVFHLMDPQNRGRLKDGAANFMRGTDFSQDAERSWSFTVNEARRKEFDVDDPFVFKFRGGSPQLVDFPNSAGVTAYKIEADGYPNMFLRSVEGTRFNILHCKSGFGERNPEGILSGIADGVHVRGHVRGPWMEGLSIEGIGDDGVALFARPASIAEPVSGSYTRKALLKADFFNLVQGDAVSFFQPTQGRILLETQVVEVKPQADGTFLVEFADDLPTELIVDGKLTEVTQIWNRSKSCGDFALRHSNFSQIRRYGAVFRSKGGLVENNRFNGVSTHAIVFKNGAIFPNGLYASEIVVRHNEVTESGFDWNGQPNLSFHFSGLRRAARTIGPRNLWLESNHFIDCPSPEIFLNHVRNAQVINNRATTGGSSKPATVKANNSEDIRVIDAAR